MEFFINSCLFLLYIHYSKCPIQKSRQKKARNLLKTAGLLFCPLGGRGWAPLRVAPTTLMSEAPHKNRETELSKTPFPRLFQSNIRFQRSKSEPQSPPFPSRPEAQPLVLFTLHLFIPLKFRLNSSYLWAIIKLSNLRRHQL